MLTMAEHPKNVPLDDTAVLSPRIVSLLGLKKDGEIIVVFPLGTPYTRIKKIADRHEAEIYRCYARVSYEILPGNEFYDTSPQVSL